MSSLPTVDIHCPYCGELITIFVDDSVSDQQRYTEDCQVCCQPIVIDVAMGEDGELRISARSEDEA